MHGARDDSNIVSEATTYQLFDLAELAARLGSIVSYIRSGSVFSLETFERGLGGWTQAKSGATSVIALTNEWMFSGPVGVVLTSGTEAAAHAHLLKRYPLPAAGKIALSTHFSLGTFGLGYDFFITYCDGTYYYWYWIQYNHDTGELALYNETGGDAIFATITPLYDQPHNTHAFKLVIDIAEGRYDKLYLDQQLFDLSGYLPYQDDAIYPAYLEAYLGVWGQVGWSTTMYLDNIVLTYNED